MLTKNTSYKLLDCGNHKKVEIFGDYKLIRPCPQALWTPFDPQCWEGAHSEYLKTEGEKGRWKKVGAKDKKNSSGIPSNWQIQAQGLEWKVEPNEFGNLGVFTEHWIYTDWLLNNFNPSSTVLNLFSYTGSSCIALVKNGYKVTVVDSSRAAMDDYVYNLGLNQIDRTGQRLILEDCQKFISKEQRRGKLYDSIMIDAPSFGRGSKKEVFKIEDHLKELLITCKKLLSKKGKLVLTLHSPRFTPQLLDIFVSSIFKGRQVISQEILNPCESGINLPSGFLVKVS